MLECRIALFPNVSGDYLWKVCRFSFVVTGCFYAQINLKICLGKTVAVTHCGRLKVGVINCKDLTG